MYNLIEYNSSYSEITGSLWFYSKDEVNNFNNDIANTNNLKYFKYKAILLENAIPQSEPNAANRILRNATMGAPLKYLSNFWRSLEIPLINCKKELKFKWTKYCVSPSVGTENNINKNTNVNNFIFNYPRHKIISSCSNIMSKRQ